MCYCTPSPQPGNGGGVGSGEDGHFHSHCTLIKAFFNFTIKLSATQQILWEEWLIDIQDNILANVSLTEDQKVVLISYSLKAFFSVHIDIYNVLSFEKIDNWGFVIDFLYVSVQIQLEITQSIVAVDSNGKCGATKALENAGKSLNAQDKSKIDALIIEINAHLDVSISVGFTYEQRLALVWQSCEAFFVTNPSLRSFVLSVEIEAYGSFESFLDVCHVFERTTSLSLVISGKTKSDCVLIQALYQASLNASFSPSVQMQIGQLQLKIETFFSVEVDFNVRLEFVSWTIHDMFKLQPFQFVFIEQISCGEWGDIIDLIFCSGICTNYGCGNTNWGPGPQGGSTVGPTVVPVKPADCSTTESCFTPDSNNCTKVTDVLLTAYATWTPGQRIGFNSCFNRVRKAIWDNITFNTVIKKKTELKSAFNAYQSGNVTNQQLVFNLSISVWQGTIGQFVGCL
jgi:hypothetical protein